MKIHTNIHLSINVEKFVQYLTISTLDKIVQIFKINFKFFLKILNLYKTMKVSSKQNCFKETAKASKEAKNIKKNLAKPD